MIGTIRFTSARSDVVLLWSACLVTLCAGCFLALGVLGAAIDREHERSARIIATIRANAEILASRPALESAERAIAERNDRFALGSDKPTTVARFIGILTQRAALHSVTLMQIDDRGAASLARAATAAAADNPFTPIPLDVTLGGSYRDLVTTIRELARAPVTMQIEIAAIERNATSPTAGVHADLTARLHIILEHLGADEPPASPPIRPHPEDPTSNARPL